MKKFQEKDLIRIIDKMFEIADINYPGYEKLKSIDDWYIKYTRSRDKEEVFRDYLKKELKPFVPKLRLEKEVDRFVLNYSLKVLGD